MGNFAIDNFRGPGPGYGDILLTLRLTRPGSGEDTVEGSRAGEWDTLVGPKGICDCWVNNRSNI